VLYATKIMWIETNVLCTRARNKTEKQANVCFEEHLKNPTFVHLKILIYLWGCPFNTDVTQMIE